MDQQQPQALVDGFDQSQFASQQVDGANAAVGAAAAALSDFIMDVAGGKHGLGTAAQVAGVEALLQAALAVGEFCRILAFTRNPSGAGVMGICRYSLDSGNTEGFRVFS